MTNFLANPKRANGVVGVLIPKQPYWGHARVGTNVCRCVLAFRILGDLVWSVEVWPREYPKKRVFHWSVPSEPGKGRNTAAYTLIAKGPMKRRLADDGGVLCETLVPFMGRLSLTEPLRPNAKRLCISNAGQDGASDCPHSWVGTATRKRHRARSGSETCKRARIECGPKSSETSTPFGPPPGRTKRGAARSVGDDQLWSPHKRLRRDWGLDVLLPDEILLQIMEACTLGTLARLACTSMRMAALTQDPCLQRSLYLRAFPPCVPPSGARTLVSQQQQRQHFACMSHMPDVWWFDPHCASNDAVDHGTSAAPPSPHTETATALVSDRTLDRVRIGDKAAWWNARCSEFSASARERATRAVSALVTPVCMHHPPSLLRTRGYAWAYKTNAQPVVTKISLATGHVHRIIFRGDSKGDGLGIEYEICMLASRSNHVSFVPPFPVEAPVEREPTCALPFQVRYGRFSGGRLCGMGTQIVGADPVADIAIEPGHGMVDAIKAKHRSRRRTRPMEASYRAIRVCATMWDAGQPVAAVVEATDPSHVPSSPF